MSQLRAYVYKCRRCGVVYEDTELAGEANLIEETVQYYAIPDKVERKRLEKEAEENEEWIIPLDGSIALDWHECFDEGEGIADIIGCSPIYEEGGIK